MKTKNSPLILTLLLALLAIIPAAQAQGDGYKQWGTHALRVHTQPGKRPTIADFARAFTKQYPTPLNTAALAKLDGKAPQPKSCTLEYLLDAPSGYLKYSFHENSCNRTDYPTMEMCYWRTDAGHCLVAVNGNTYRGNLLLVFYDYNPTTGLMTPLSKPPFKDLHDDVREFIVQLPRKGKDIHLEGWSDRSAPAPLTLRWDGLGGFTLVGAAERYRQPAPNQPTTCDFLALFKPEVTTGGEPVDLYDAPDGKVIRHLTDNDLDYDLRVKRAENGWAYVDYGNNLLGAGSSEGSAWVRCTSLYVLPAGPVYTNYIYAEPTRASHRVATFDQAKDNSSDIWWKVLEIRKGWVKIRTTHLGITGWIESRILCGSIGVDC